MTEEKTIKKSALSPTVLLVGGAGFIGSHLSEALLEKGARVLVVDNFSSGKDVFVNALLENPKFALFDADINKGLPAQIKSVDYIIHLAGLETYLFDKGDLNLDSLLTNALGTKNVLDFAKESSAKFLLASTLDVYKGLISPLSLDDYFGHTDAEEKQYSLAEAKRYAEALVWEYYQKHQIDVRIARLPEIYGPRMNLNSSGTLGSLLKNVMNNNDLVVYGEGTEKEYYLYISDAISGLVKALFTDGSKGKIYTFAPREGHTELETTYIVKALANAEIKVVFKPSAEKPRPQKPPTVDRSNLADIKWEEKKNFKTGIKETLEWFGYDTNEHSFKPNKLVEDKKAENTVGKEVSSIVAQDSITQADVSQVSVSQSSYKQNQEVSQGASAVDTKKSEKEKAMAVATALAVQQNLKEPAKPFKRRFRLKNKLTEVRQKLKLTSPVSRKKTKQEIVVPGIYKEYSKKVQETKASKRAAVLAAYVALLVAVGAIFIGVPALQTYIHARSGVTALEQTQTALLDLNSEQAQLSANKAYKEFYGAQSSLNRLSWLFSLTGQTERFVGIQKLLNSAGYSAKTTYFLAKGSQPFLHFWDSIKPSSEVVFNEQTFSQASADFLTAKENLLLAQAELTQTTLGKLPTQAYAYKDKLNSLTNLMDALVVLSDSLPDIAGLEGKRTYLLLFQNSNEIRPTGGFIGSYAIIEMENGKVSNLLIDDIYNPDGQIDLRGIDVPAPGPIATFLTEDKLHIRNANWEPDFSDTANQIEELFFKLDGREFDGVLAVDLHFVQNILDVTGPVFLTAYNEEINSANLYERAQFHSEFNFEAGSIQKRAFLTVLGGKILERIFSLDGGELVTLAGSMQKSLDEKHLLIDIPNSPLTAYLQENGWDGRLAYTAGDYLYVVNANLGGTKANYYVKNDMEYDVFSATRDGLLRAELVLTYTHTGKDSSWPGGPYTNYVRVLAQTGAKLTNAQIVFSDGTTQDVFGNVITSKVKDYTAFELGFVLQPDQTATLLLGYDLAQNLALTPETNTYDLYWQKQPGTQDDNINFKFSAPFGVDIINTNPPMTVGGTTAEYTGVLNSDTEMHVEFN